MSLVLAVMFALLTLSPATAATLLVGPGRTYATPCAALAAAVNNDTIQIDGDNPSGGAQLVYSDDSCAFTQTGLTITGNGTHRPLVRRTAGSLTSGALWYANPASASTLTISNVEMSGAHVITRDAAPVKGVNTSFTFTNVYFHHNDNGIRGTDENVVGSSRTSDVTISASEFAYNGSLTEGGNTDFASHNVFFGRCHTASITSSFIHDARGGHGIVSHCNTTSVLYNRLADLPSGVEIESAVEQPTTCCTGETAEELSFPTGGLVYVLGNIIYQDALTRNFAFLHYNSEHPPAGTDNDFDELYVTYNTFIDGSGTNQTVGIWTDFANPTVQTISQNIFAGFVAGSKVLATGTAVTGQTTPANNSVFTTIGAASFTDALSQNYHLGSSSATNAATVDPGSAHGFSLNPVSQYLHPRQLDPRTIVASVRDRGAYETNATLGSTIDRPHLFARPVGSTIVVRWTPALSDNPITAYTLFRDGVILASHLTTLSYTDVVPAVSIGQVYQYMVSGESATVCGGNSDPSTAALVVQSTTTPLPAFIGFEEMQGTALTTIAVPTTNAASLLTRTASTFDSENNRVVFFGNGGVWPSNAILALNAGNWSVSALNATDSPLGSGAEITAGGRPNARQTYNGIAWLPDTHKLFLSGGYRVETGFLQDVWQWTPGTNVWTHDTPTGTIPAIKRQAAEYDPLTNDVWILTQDGCLDSYDTTAHVFTRNGACTPLVASSVSVALDTTRRRLYQCSPLSCGYFNLTTFTYTAITDPGCVPLMVALPGLVFDTSQANVVGWIGGSHIYTLDPTTNTCSERLFEGDPGFPPSYEVGGGFQYLANTNEFMAAPRADQNISFLRLDLAPPPPTPRDFSSLVGAAIMRGKATFRRLP